MMTNENLDLSSLKNAIGSLDAALEIISNHKWFDEQIPAVRNTIVAGVIQNFECVYEISIKMIRRTIELEAASPSEVDETNFRDLLRTAAEKGMIHDVNAWFEYRAMRNITSHTYDEAKARAAHQEIVKFVDDAKRLLNQLVKRHV